MGVLKKQEKEIRKYYIDNLRNSTILLLFPVHTFMVWNDFGSRFYIWQEENKILSTCIVLVTPWFMPLLFVLAGMSARYALEKKTNKMFCLQRAGRLMVPFVFGLIVLVPFQALYARKFFYQYQGGILAHWKYFFTHLTDLSGYDGAFTLGHLWFILFLFFISILSLALFHWMPYQKAVVSVGKMPVFAVVFFFLLVWLMYYLGNFGGFSLGKDFALYVIGYYVLSNEVVIGKLEKNMGWLVSLSVMVTMMSAVFYYRFSYYGDLWVNFVGWVCVLALLAVGKRFLNKKMRFTEYFNRASYPIYLLHQSILVALSYYVVQITDILWMQVSCICMGSFLLTVLVYHVIRYFLVDIVPLSY